MLFLSIGNNVPIFARKFAEHLRFAWVGSTGQAGEAALQREALSVRPNLKISPAREILAGDVVENRAMRQGRP